MGLFSFLHKNKQETTGDDSGYYSSADDDTVAARARSKRASSAGDAAPKRGKGARGDAADPVLPEKKRARRRLVGAVALALAVAVGLPMLLDSEPKQLASDIAIQIPSKDKAAPLPVPSRVPAADALDKREIIVEPLKAASAPVVTAAPAVAEVTAPAAKPEAARQDARAAVKADAKPAAKAPLKEDKPAVAAAAAKPAPAAPNDDVRALAILEGKAAADAQKYVLQVAALASQEKVNELQGKLKDNGIKSFTQKGTSGDKSVIRVRVGPFSKDEAEKMRARLDKLGLSGSMIPT